MIAILSVTIPALAAALICGTLKLDKILNRLDDEEQQAQDFDLWEIGI